MTVGAFWRAFGVSTLGSTWLSTLCDRADTLPGDPSRRWTTTTPCHLIHFRGHRSPSGLVLRATAHRPTSSASPGGCQDRSGATAPSPMAGHELAAVRAEFDGSSSGFSNRVAGLTDEQLNAVAQSLVLRPTDDLAVHRRRHVPSRVARPRCSDRAGRWVRRDTPSWLRALADRERQGRCRSGVNDQALTALGGGGELLAAVAGSSPVGSFRHLRCRGRLPAGRSNFDAL